MTYQDVLVRYTWTFSIIGTDEVAETGLMVSPGTGDANAFVTEFGVDTTAASAMVTAMAVLLAGSTPPIIWANFSELASFKVAPLDTAGHYTAPPYIYNVPPSRPAGVDATCIPESSVVLSLRADAFTGDATKGRMYLPHTRMLNSSGTPFADSTKTTALAARGADFINSINTTADLVQAGSVAVIASKKGTGTTNPVNSVRVGNVVDVQRRRRNRLPETYAVDFI